jgi:hypothetical protein
MIIVKLMGGLGNQMFQYSFARNLSVILNTSVKLDLSFLNSHSGDTAVTPRNYELNVWKIQAEIAGDSEITPFSLLLHAKKNGLFGKLFKRTGPERIYYKEKDFTFDPQAFDLKGDIYLDGHWQSEKYFQQIENTIRNEFEPSSPLDETNRLLAGEIGAAESVSIHVRRMDYLKDKSTLDFHGVCSPGYYREAVSLISKKYDKVQLYVFSDDPDWSEKNLKFDLPVIHVNHNKAEKSYLDLWLMSRCKHQIIANSSFSWWGAWLNPNLQKTVIAPRKWFAGPIPDTSDLIPNSWTCL